MLRLTQERKRLGMSQAKLARLAEINASSLSRIEGGKELAYPHRGKRIAEALGWTGDPMELFEEVDRSAEFVLPSGVWPHLDGAPATLVVRFFKFSNDTITVNLALQGNDYNLAGNIFEFKPKEKFGEWVVWKPIDTNKEETNA